MEEEQYPDRYNTHAQDMNVDAYTTETALRIRLDTIPIKYQIQMFLEGKQESIEKNQAGNLVKITKDRGIPMANAIGIQRIMSYVESAINSQVVQGNLKQDQYEWFMMRTRKELARHLFVNMYDWGIKEEEYPLISDMICLLIELFVSRVVNNEERKSYANFMSHFENSQSGFSQKKETLWNKMGIGK